jgi:uncharacterized protein (TIGR02246 family)
MKVRLLLTLAGLSIGFAVPVLAEEKNVVNPQISQQLDALGGKFDEVFNKNDAAAVAAFYTEDVVLVTPGGLVYGRQAIEKWHADLFQKSHYSNRITKFDQNSLRIIGTAGNEIWVAGEWSVTVQDQNGPPLQHKGYFSAVDMREGDTWKIRMTTFNATPQPAKPTNTK